ncbi:MULTISPECIES: ABC transporter permease [Staphylococcus]|uniref:ABC transporter permease n=1 Tax=Staphylococcus TaxID=1279 RepID=UPI0014041DC9|nr:MULTISPECIES: ABC transporter permease [Staphylococcus]MDW3865721.1 ABC transporter permease [Staphylococcus saprophyticus]
MVELIDIIKEQYKHSTQIFKLAIYNIKSEYANHYLGIFWNVLQPLLQLIVYYLVFGLGLRSGGDELVNGIPFIIHLITGLFPWLFISQGINSGASAITKNISLLSKMTFPSSVFLSITLTNNVINLFITTSIIFLISLFNLSIPMWQYLYFFYFLFSAIVLVYSISLITSTMVVLIKDIKNLLQNIIRMLFFMTPIFWAVEESNEILKTLVKLNPFSYLIEIYRLSFVQVYSTSYLTWSDHLYFWALTITLLLIGSIIHHYFQGKLLDYL